MSDIKPIRSRADYDDAITLLSELIDANPARGTADDSKLQILTTLVEDYEGATLPDYTVDPIEAIKLRLDQLGLKDVDLVPYLGARSRVSEILAGKRPLTVAMIKNLEDGLGIPASILVGSGVEKKNKRWTPKTIATMARRGYFGPENASLEPKRIVELGLIRELFTNKASTPQYALLRQSSYRNISNIDQYHMAAWSKKVLNEAIFKVQQSKVPEYDSKLLGLTRLHDLFRLSRDADGVTKILDELAQVGVIVVIEPQLPGTKLDGATFFTKKNPIIGLTLRYDRLDNYWFTLAHELAHVYLHSGLDYSAFYDHLVNDSQETSKLEAEADMTAGDLLIPAEAWKTSPLKYASTPTLIRAFAEKVGVHESVIAGRIRFESKDWTIHSELAYESSVREKFEDIVW